MSWATSDRRSRLPRDWPRIRRRILNRDDHRCRWVEHGQRCTHPATDVDHIRAGDDHSESNLQALCSDHHRAKTTAETIVARSARKRTPERHPGLL